MLIFVWLLLSAVATSKEECLINTTETQGKTEYNFLCTNTNHENFFYDIQNVSFPFEEDSIYDLEIENSEFVHIYTFLLPLPPDLRLRSLSLRNASTEFIRDGAFEEFAMSSVDLSDNKLEDITFVQSLPQSVEKLILIRNHFKAIGDVFRRLPILKYIDLSYCKITKIVANTFLSLRGDLFISIRSNNLTSFDALFQDNIILQLDLSCNNITAIDNKSKRIYFKSLNASHNKIKEVIDMSCLDCPYNFYRWSKNVIDLSFNDLKNIKFINSFNDIKLGSLLLSNSNIDSNFDFKISRNVHQEMDLSNNRLRYISPKMFGSNISLSYLNLFNSSIIDIDSQGFDGLSTNVLNMSSNKLKQLKNFVFQKSTMEILDLSRCLIETIEDRAFTGLELTELLNLSHNKLRHLQSVVFTDFHAVKIIDLSFNFLKSIQENLFQRCHSLKILNLANSEIETINRKAFDGTNLQQLRLENNLLNDVDFTFKEGEVNLSNNTFNNLSLSFLRATSAAVVILSKNNIGSLSKRSRAQVTSLKRIDLSHSNLSEIDVDAFQGLTSLQFLNLSHNSLETIASNTFLPLLQLQCVDLRNNRLVAVSESAFFFGNVLKNLAISFSDAKINANSFITLNSLKTLNISNSRIVSFRKNCFKGLILLETINFSNVEVGDVAPGAFNGLNHLQNVDFRVVFKNFTVVRRGTFEGLLRLESLDLTELRISSLEIGAFVGLQNLYTLLLNSSKIETIVNGTFQGLHSLKYLDLSNNLIVTLEAKSFSGLPNLRELIVSNNNLTRLRLGTFQEFPQLRRLNLYNNNINKLLTGTFSNLKSLEMLNLSYNNVTKLKMQVLMPLTGLIHLDLTGNHLIQITHLEFIKSLRHLEFIGIKGNKWKCDNLAAMLMVFQNVSVNWVSNENSVFDHENIDGIKCYDICKFFYCVDEAEVLWGQK